MALVSADSRIAELLGELHQLIKQTQEERSRSEHNLVNIQKTHERMQTENKSESPPTTGPSFGGSTPRPKPTRRPSASRFFSFFLTQNPTFTPKTPLLNPHIFIF
ncbi:SAGA-associated factor 29 isoform X1 [Phalacrocorax carbo]|uniref:SAGA-associated factor 29 isoform X1 n=1 Tax=Phalacrocorax carbo TaxID=9209 RepID=UPI0031199420